MKKHFKKTTVLLLAVGLMASLLLFVSYKGEAAPTGYAYFKQMTVAGSAAGALSNYPLKLTVNKGTGTDRISAPPIDSYTKLLLQANGIDGSTLFFDSASVPKTMTANGNAQIDTAQSKFNGASGLFDGNGDFVTTPNSADFQVGSGNFTIDTWVRMSALPASGNSYMVFWYGNDGNWYNSVSMWVASNGAVYGAIYDASAGDTAGSSVNLTTNTWYHIAFIRSGGNLYIAVNGTLGSPTATSRTVGVPDASPVTELGAKYGTTYRATYGDFYNGWIDEFRFSKGIARWTSNFIPPADEYGSNTATVYLNNHALSWTGTVPNDIYFTAPDGMTALDYWIESSDANTATVWVELDSIPASPSAAIFYLYYGKSSVTSASNGNNTFPFFDDFNDASLDTNKWQITNAGGTYSESGGELTVTAGSGATETISSKTASFGTNYAARTRAHYSAPLYYNAVGFVTSRGVNNGALYTSAFRAGVNEGNFLPVSGDDTNYTTVNSGVPLSTDYRVWEARRASGVYDAFYSNDVACGAGQFYTSISRYIDIASLANSTVTVVDWIAVRPYVAAGPSFSAWGNESAVICPVGIDNGNGTCTATFYPDANPESATVDGYVGRVGASLAWADARTGAGTAVVDNDTYVVVGQIETDATAYGNIYRGIALFDASVLPDTAVISNATVSIFGRNTSMNSFTGLNPAANIFSVVPAANTALAASDYGTFGTTPLATAIPYSSWSATGYNNWTLNSAGIATISLTGITKFGFRESNYDAPNNTPTFEASKQLRFYGYSADQGSGYKPKLTITYSMVPVVTTQAATNIQATSATGNGNITSLNGGSNCDLRGVRWGTSSGVYTSSSTDSGSFGTGAFTKDMTGLSAETTYYYQAMAHNSLGWGYGSEQSFKTAFDSSFYAYHKQITVVGSTAGAQTNYQSRFTVNKGVGTDSPSGKFEYYNTGDDDVGGGNGATWQSQTFTPSVAHTITSVKLLALRVGSPGTLTVGIRATSGGLPTGSDLCSGTMNGNSLTTSTAGAWYEITLGAGCALSASTKYAIVVRAPNGDVNNIFRLRGDLTSPAYTGGTSPYSLDSGSSWTDVSSRDFMFEEWGSGTVYLNNHALSWTGTVPNDIRFTKSDGTTPLDYWIESSDANTATVWVEFDSIPASPSTATFYLFYGKSSVLSAANGNNTFILFDDFTGTTIDAAKWTKVDVGSYISQNGELIISNGTAVWGETGVYSNTDLSRSNIAVQGKYRSTVARGATYKDTTLFWMKDNTTSVQYGNMIYGTYLYEQGGVYYMYMYEDGTSRGSIGTWTAGTQYWFRQIVKSSAGATTQWSTDGNSWSNLYDSSYSSESPMKIGFVHYQGGDVFIDDVLVYKYVSPAPTFSAWGSEQAPTPTVTTQAATNIQATSTTGNGNITSIGSGNCDLRGVRWGTVSGTYTSSSTDSGSFGTGAFTKDMTGLSAETTYYYQAMAHNSSGWGYGSEQSFSTPQTPCQDHNVFGYAWSENIGWISFSCKNTGVSSDYGVDIATSTGVFSGYAWSENIGWIDLAPSGSYPATPNYSTKLTVGNGEVSGWARACTVFQTGCSGTLKSDDDKGGWDGWIKMRGTAYGVSIDGGTGDFSGYAYSDTVMGWINFQGTGYKVQTTFLSNQPPNQPSSNTETQNGCAWGTVPQTALGQAVTFSWTYSDPDSDPQTAYEVEVDTDTSFAATKFNHLVSTAGTSYVLNLTQDDNSDWLSSLAWNTTYYWHVRVKDDQNSWSVWSTADSFQTPAHAYPSPNFTHQPAAPAIDEVVTFTDTSNCYDSGDVSFFCKNISGTSYQWDFENNGSIDSTTKGSATATFPGTGSYSTKLYVTDDVGTCNTLGDTPIGVTVPLPEYKEVPPVIWLKKAFLAFVSFLSPLQ